MQKIAFATALSLLSGTASAAYCSGLTAVDLADGLSPRTDARAIDDAGRDRGYASTAARPMFPTPKTAAAVSQDRPGASPSSSTSPVAAPASPLRLRNGMVVVSSDGVVVGDVMHVNGEVQAFQADETFFTADSTYRLRRIYAREAQVRGDRVVLTLTAAQYRARGQNPGQ